MEYHLDLNPRPFEAIKNKTKKVEGRVPTKNNKNIPFEKIKSGDLISFKNNETGEIIKTKVIYIKKYVDFKTMLENEGPENVLSSKGTIEEGIESYNKFEGYKEGVKKYGVYAIRIELV